jgi:acyl-CoA thioester hydrolase
MGKQMTQFRLRVRFAETDQMGIAHHGAYVVWMEAARVEWLRERGMSYKEWEREGVSLAVSGIDLEYRASATFDDELIIETNLIEARSRRFRFRYVITRVADNAFLAKGSSLHTPMDQTGRAIRLPEKWLRGLERYLEPTQ